jgi:hypothetical protein
MLFNPPEVRFRSIRGRWCNNHDGGKGQGMIGFMGAAKRAAQVYNFFVCG